MKKKQDGQKKSSIENIYQLDGSVPLLNAIPFGLQHVLAMFVSNIGPIMIVASACHLEERDLALLIQSAMLIAGIGTLIQLFPIGKRIGSGLPIVMGISYTFVSVGCLIGTKYGYGTFLGAVLIGGIIEGLLGYFAKYWIRIMSPIVSATVVTAIGFSLFPVGANSFGGGQGAEDFGSITNWVIGSVTLLMCILFSIFAKVYMKQLSILAGLVTGYICAVVLGKVDFSVLGNTSFIEIPRFVPYQLEFNIHAIIAVTLIFLVSATETIGDTSALCSSGLGRDATDREISGSLACDGFVSALSSIFGCMPITSYSQNVGLVAMTKVVNRRTIATGAAVIIAAGIFPFFGALLSTLPSAVLGGCTLMMFGNIVISGIQMISKCGLSERNIMICALSLSIGLGFTQVSEIFDQFPTLVREVFAENCVAVVFVVAVILNLLLPGKKNKGGQPGCLK